MLKPQRDLYFRAPAKSQTSSACSRASDRKAIHIPDVLDTATRGEKWTEAKYQFRVELARKDQAQLHHIARNRPGFPSPDTVQHLLYWTGRTNIERPVLDALTVKPNFW